MNRFVLLQLADGAFPSGGFAHSNGLEAAAQLGATRGEGDVRHVLDAALLQAATSQLPFALAARDATDSAGVAALDVRLDALLLGHVQNRASRAQGRSFLTAAARAFDEPLVLALDRAVRARELAGHHAPLFGAVLGAAGATREETATVLVHQTMRASASALVRLGLLGPNEAQRLQRAMAPRLDELASVGLLLALGDAAHPAPALDVLAGAHDRLYSRLFQS